MDGETEGPVPGEPWFARVGMGAAVAAGRVTGLAADGAPADWEPPERTPSPPPRARSPGEPGGMIRALSERIETGSGRLAAAASPV